MCVCVCVCVYIYIVNGHIITKHSNSHAQLVGSEPQRAIGHYIILTAKAPNIIHHKIEYRVSPHCLQSYEGLRVYNEVCGRM